MRMTQCYHEAAGPAATAGSEAKADSWNALLIMGRSCLHSLCYTLHDMLCFYLVTYDDVSLVYSQSLTANDCVACIEC